MISVLYNGYLIVSVAIEEDSTHRWGLTVDITTRQPGLQSHSIYTPYEFEAKEEAERYGMEEARAWVEKQSPVINGPVEPAPVTAKMPFPST